MGRAQCRVGARPGEDCVRAASIGGSVSPARSRRLGGLAIAMLLAGCGSPSGDSTADDTGEGTTTSSEEVLGRVDVVSIRGESTWVMTMVRSDGTEVECQPETCGDGRAVFEAAPQELTQCALERDRGGLSRLFRHSSTRTLCTAGADIDNEGSVKTQLVADCT